MNGLLHLDLRLGHLFSTSIQPSVKGGLCKIVCVRDRELYFFKLIPKAIKCKSQVGF